MRTILSVAIVAVIVCFVGCVGPSSEERVINRGRYLVEIMGCNDCHTPDYLLEGADVPEDDWLVGDLLGYHGPWGTAYPTNLRLLLNNMSEQEWLVMAKKMRKDSPMSWVMLPRATDQDLLSIYRFVRHLGPKGRPAPRRLPAGVKPGGPIINFPVPH